MAGMVTRLLVVILKSQFWGGQALTLDFLITPRFTIRFLQHFFFLTECQKDLQIHGQHFLKPKQPAPIANSSFHRHASTTPLPKCPLATSSDETSRRVHLSHCVLLQQPIQISVQQQQRTIMVAASAEVEVVRQEPSMVYNALYLMKLAHPLDDAVRVGMC